MVYIRRGYTLTDGLANNYNFSTLHALVDSATVTSIAMTEFSSSSHVVQTSGTEPGSDQGDGSLWFDSALGVLRTKNGDARWDCNYVGPEMNNNTGATIPRGTLVVASGDGTIAPCLTGMWPEALGVLAATAANGADALVISKGLGLARVIGPVTIGNMLIASGTGVFAFGSGTMRSIHSTGMSTATLGIGVARCWASLASGVTALVTCSIWR